jgi:hypothetical protein
MFVGNNEILIANIGIKKISLLQLCLNTTTRTMTYIYQYGTLIYKIKCTPMMLSKPLHMYHVDDFVQIHNYLTYTQGGR